MAAAPAAMPRPRAATEPVVPQGPLTVIVSIDQQRATLFANGQPVASTAISSGTRSHPTPMGVFSVIQKRRHHVSNLYGAQMPFMQRLTWSGTAMHQGPLPGRPASHGCIRLPKDFAQLLWKATRIGARVVVTRDEVAPVAIAHRNLFQPAPPMAQLPRAVVPASPRALIKTADATHAIPASVAAAMGKPVAAQAVVRASAAAQPTKLLMGADGNIEMLHPAAPVATPAAVDAAKTVPTGTAPTESEPEPANDPALKIMVDEPPRAAAPAPRAAKAKGKPEPVSVFVSRKEGKLYVRQAMEPLFEAPVAIVDPDAPIGTHVYTAMGSKDGGGSLRWTAVSIPSGYARPDADARSAKGKKRKTAKVAEPVALDPEPVPGADAALDRLIMPPDAVDRIAALITPGSSLIVSDNKLSGETGKSTGFIVLTR
jgi:hypothetical protein